MLHALIAATLFYESFPIQIFEFFIRVFSNWPYKLLLFYRLPTFTTAALWIFTISSYIIETFLLVFILSPWILLFIHRDNHLLHYIYSWYLPSLSERSLLAHCIWVSISCIPLSIFIWPLIISLVLSFPILSPGIYQDLIFQGLLQIIFQYYSIFSTHYNLNAIARFV